jgi:transglutaminase-like putative cysteine protease
MDAYLAPTGLAPMSRQIAAFARSLGGSAAKPVVAAEKIMTRLHESFRFQPGATHAGTTADQFLSEGRGVCQDFVHLSIAALRSMDIPSRYVSGYVHTAAFRGSAHRIASDASHAWFEIFDPGTGWTGFDPANGRLADHHYITVARGRDYNDVCPLSGRYEGEGTHTLNVSVDVQRIISAPQDGD